MTGSSAINKGRSLCQPFKGFGSGDSKIACNTCGVCLCLIRSEGGDFVVIIDDVEEVVSLKLVHLYSRRTKLGKGI